MEAGSSAPIDVARPAVDLAGLGLEVRGWVVDNRDHRLGDRLAGLEALDALGSDADAMWLGCGVRVLDVAVDDLPRLFESLAVGPERRLWLGQSARWTEAYAAADRGPTSIMMPEGELDLRAGTLRLLVRCWVERRLERAAGAEGSAVDRKVLRVDLIPQNRERTRSDLTLDPVDPTRALDTGLVFERLRSSWSSDGSRALVLVPAPPDEDWQAQARAVGPVADGPAVFGPAGPAMPTLGEALLGTPRDGVRIVLVFIPRTSAGGVSRAPGS